MENERVLEKVKKLLALANDRGATEGESQTALLMAQKIMAENNLTIKDVEANDKPREVIFEQTAKTSRLPWWHKSLANILSNNFKCECVTTRHHGVGGYSYVRFIGHPEDAEICKTVYQFAVGKISHLSDKYSTSYKKYQNPNANKAGIKNDYIRGYLNGVKSKFAEQVSRNNWGLVVVCDPDVTDALNSIEHLHHTKTTLNINSEGSQRAYKDGYINGHDFEPTIGAIEQAQ